MGLSRYIHLSPPHARRLTIMSRKSKRSKAIKLPALSFVDPDGLTVRTEDASMAAGAKRQRRVGVIEEWFKRGVIDQAEYDAANQFSEEYQFSKLMPRYASMRLGAITGGDEDGPEWIHARQKRCYHSVQRVKQVVGARAAVPLVAIVAEGQSMRAFAGGGVQAAQVRGTLQVALDVLATHYCLRNV